MISNIVHITDNEETRSYTYKPYEENEMEITHMFYKDNRSERQIKIVDKAYKHQMEVTYCLFKEMEETGLTIDKEGFRSFCADMIGHKKEFDNFNLKYDLIGSTKHVKFKTNK